MEEKKPTVSAEEIAEQFPWPVKPILAVSDNIIAFPVTAKRSTVSGVMYSRVHRKLRFWIKGGKMIQFHQVAEEYFLEHISHGATVDEKIPLYFNGKFLKSLVDEKDMDNWDV